MFKGEEDFMNHNAILKWAAGSNVTLQLKLEYDEESLLHLVDSHNLSGRFLHKLENHDAPSFSRKLVNGLRKLHTQTQEKVAANIDAFRRIKERLPADLELFIIKGVSTYVLTGNEKVIRAGDVDVLCGNTTKLEETLREMKFRQTRPPFLHEVGEYTKGLIEVDIHAYFPVYSYTKRLRDAELSPSVSDSPLWRQNFGMRQRQITFDDLMKHSFQGTLPETQGVAVADPNILAIIICAHAFMNYTNMWSISHREKVYVRLGELADLFELVETPTFDQKIFNSLVKKFDAHDAVAWTANIAAILFSKNPFPYFAVTEDKELLAHRFPRCLWWKFWINTALDEETLLQKWWFPIDRLTRELNANELIAEKGATGQYATVRKTNCFLLNRLISQKTSPIPLTIKIILTENEMIIKITLKSNDKTDKYRFRIDFGHFASEWIYSPFEKNKSSIGNDVKVKVKISVEGFDIQFSYLREKIGRTVFNIGKLPLLIGIAQFFKEDLINSTLIPLIVKPIK